MKSHLNISFKFVLPATFLVLGVLYLVLFAGFVDGPFNPAVLSIIAVGWLVLGQKGKLPLEKPILAFLSVLALTSLTSIDPRRSFSEVLAIGTGFFLIFVISEIVKRWISANFIFTLLLVIGLGLMLLSWSDTLRWYIQWLRSSPGQWIPGISYRLNGSNLMAAYYNLILMLAAARFIHAKTWLLRIGWVFYCFSALVLISCNLLQGGLVRHCCRSVRPADPFAANYPGCTGGDVEKTAPSTPGDCHPNGGDPGRAGIYRVDLPASLCLPSNSRPLLIIPRLHLESGLARFPAISPLGFGPLYLRKPAHAQHIDPSGGHLCPRP